MLETAHSVASAPGANHDRVAVVPVRNGLVLLVADGSNGTSGAAEAADQAIRELTDAAKAEDVLCKQADRLAAADLVAAHWVDARVARRL